MSFFKRLLSKIFDYTLFFSILYLIGNKLDIVKPQLLASALAITTPLLWILVETFLLKICGSTPGKALLGIRLQQKPTLKKSFILSLLPFGQKDQFTYKTGGALRIILSLLLITIFTASPIICDHLHKKSILTIQTEGYENWTAHPGDLFSAYFPAKPESADNVIPTPDDYEDLQVTEYKATLDDTEYSIAYATVPPTFLKYSNSMILKHTMKGMANQMEDTTIVHRDYSEHGSHKAVDYVLNSKGKTITGRMLLVNDRMYKIEVTSDPSTEIATQVDLFRSAFIPN